MFAVAEHRLRILEPDKKAVALVLLGGLIFVMVFGRKYDCICPL